MVVQVKTCGDCGGMKPVCDGPESAFAIHSRSRGGRVTGWAPRCKPCAAARRTGRGDLSPAELEAARQRDRERYYRSISTPGGRRRRRERERAASARARERDPDRARATWRRYYRRQMQSSAARREMNERQRLQYRLEQERRGAEAVRNLAEVDNTGEPTVPVEPLLDFLTRYWLPRCRGQWQRVERATGIPARLIRRWRAGETERTRFLYVDRATTPTPIGYWEIYPEEQFPELYAV